MSKQIALSKGQVALVDDADFARLSGFKWYAFWSHDTQSFYAYRTAWTGSEYRTWFLSRAVLGLERGDKREADHINHDTLDNTRSNLRIVTSAQNKWNARMRKDNTTGFVGVKRAGSKFYAQIRINGTRYHLGSRDTAEAAYLELYLPAANARATA